MYVDGVLLAARTKMPRFGLRQQGKLRLILASGMGQMSIG
jgi:hypothetical protein